MAYETSYDVGLKPFNPDKNRGKWASPMDFLFACIGHAFKIDAMFVLPSLIFRDVGVWALIPYFIIMVVCTMPIIFMQSFLGQFSSSGFISVFRIAPVFKGVGYVSLSINVLTLTYYSIFAAIPLFFFIHSLRPTLPWSCEGSAHWLGNHQNRTMPCNLTTLQIKEDEYVSVEMPSVDFLKDHLNIDLHAGRHSGKWGSPQMSYSWSLMFCTFAIWILVWAVIRKPTEIIGKIIRYSTITLIAVMGICVMRFMFLPGAINGLAEFFEASHHFRSINVLLIPLLALSGLGPGWGSILTMASYNNFKTDITKFTWLLCLGQFGLMMLTSFSWIFIEQFVLSFNPEQLYMRDSHSQWIQFLSIPTALTFLEIPNLWSLLFFGMTSLGATTLLIVQLFSVLTSVFDEFEELRPRRTEVTVISCAVLALISALYCCNYGISVFEFMTKYSVLTQMFLNLMLLLVVLWIYGRERFQRDLRFMTNRTYPTWMVYIVRFVAPIVLLFAFLVGLVLALLETDYSLMLFLVVSFLMVIPWFLIPGYCIFKIMQTSGLVGMRFRRSVRPADWYPIDPVERQRFEEAYCNPEISHQLTTTEDTA